MREVKREVRNGSIILTSSETPHLEVEVVDRPGHVECSLRDEYGLIMIVHLGKSIRIMGEKQILPFSDSECYNRTIEAYISS